jgi:hypothetical protein
VATRRIKAVVPTIEYDPEDDEQAPDIKTMDMTLLPKASNEGDNAAKKGDDNAASTDNSKQAKSDKDKKKG